MNYNGPLFKMQTNLKDPVEYKLLIGNDVIVMNSFIGKHIILKWAKEILCVKCGRKTNKSFAQGFCYPCFISVPETSECILRPELCQAHEGISRNMEWSEKHCLKDHFVYLALSSGIKVGVTRAHQIPTRWIDQGAWQAIKLAKTPNRYIAGLIEVALKEYISDRTQWQRMLKNQIIEGINLKDKKNEMLNLLDNNFRQYTSKENDIIEINYPVNDYPEKVKSLSFDKIDIIAGKLWGIKGQYLMFNDGSVLNIRKHNGYNVSFKI